MADKIPKEKLGNILIYEDSTPSVPQSNDATTKSTGTSEYKTDVIEGEEAALIHHFYKKTDLLTLAQDFSVMIKNEPENRLPPNKIHLRYKASKTSYVAPIIVKMKLELKRLNRKDYTFEFNKSSQLSEFLKKEEERTDVFFQPDITERMVTVIGRDSNDVESAIHRMKLSIGAIQKTSSNRSARQVSDSGTQQDDSSAVKIKGIYPDLDNLSSEGSKTNSFISRNRNFNSSVSQVTGSNYEGSSDKFSFEEKLRNGFVLKVYEASITKLDVEVIVNAANESMMHGGGVARVISEAAGWELDDESRDHVNKNGPVQVKENIVTTSGKLKHYKAVIHAVGPTWHDYKKKVDCLNDLFDCVYNILETCKRKRYRTVGMSAISAGIFAVPKELCADMYVSAAAKFSATLEPSECPRELHIIDIDTSILKLVQESVKRWQENPESINQLVTLPKFLEANPYLAGNTSSTRHWGHGSGGHRGYRGQGHGEGSQSYDRERENDGLHGSANRHRGRSSPSNSEEIKLEIVCHVKKLKEERFTWGGVAQLYVVDKSVTVKIYKGEIDKVHGMDVIVCGINKELKSSGYIAESLKSKGGLPYTDSLNEMIQRHQMGKINISDVFKCGGGRLGTKYVFHAVVDRIIDATDFEVTKYKECVTRIFTKASAHNTVKKIAIPLIGTGQIQTNKRRLKLCGAALLNGLDDFLVKMKRPNISEVHLINNNTTVCEALTEVFDQAAGCYKNTDEDSSLSEHRSSQRGDGHRGRGSYKKSGTSDIAEKQNFNSKGNEGHRHNREREIYPKEKNEGASGGTRDSDSTVYDSDDYVVVGDVDQTDQDDQGSKAKQPKQPEPEKEPTGNLLIIIE